MTDQYAPGLPEIVIYQDGLQFTECRKGGGRPVAANNVQYEWAEQSRPARRSLNRGPPTSVSPSQALVITARDDGLRTTALTKSIYSESSFDIP